MAAVNKPERYVDQADADRDAEAFVTAVAKKWGETIPGTSIAVRPFRDSDGNAWEAWGHSGRVLLAVALVTRDAANFSLMTTKEFREPLMPPSVSKPATPGTAEIIVAAAVMRRDNARILSRPPPARHDDLIAAAVADGHPRPVYQCQQGFLTSEGRFVDRHEARELALASGQVVRTQLATKLISQDLW